MNGLKWKGKILPALELPHMLKKSLGDIVYVELPIVQKQVNAKQEVAVLESTKAAADIYSPVSGTIVEVNVKLNTTS